MFLEIILVMILIFLIIIASQNYARGGMVDEHLKIISSHLNDIRLPSRKKTKRNNPPNPLSIANK